MNTLTGTVLSMALVSAAIAAGHASAAQLYRWVDDKGSVEWRDTPPPPTAKHVEQRRMSGNTIETSTLPYSVQHATRTHPVTLWTFDCGEPCSKAAAHLASRGVPHARRDSQKEPETLQKITGGLEVPVLLVGSRQLKGYLETSWDAALDDAGYPRSAIPGPRTQAAKDGTPKP